jgi:diaminohydroxyphosphoribosylaminopyrimidine deaminase/5-amino-6-(5-phosphoribosylamino)uracil reductase
VLEDDPQLDVRLVESPRQPHLVVVDSRLQTPPDARLFGPERQRLIYFAGSDPAPQVALEARGASLVALPGPGGKVDLPALLADLARREVGELHVEAGHKLNGSLLREGLVDELLVYLAPKLLGPGRGMAVGFGPFSALDQAIALRFVDSAMIGLDLRLLARLPDRDAF